MSLIINQSDNFVGNFGKVYRSSAIFFKPKNINTTITVTNYWAAKNNLDVSLVFTVRLMSGELVERQERCFDTSSVINYQVASIDEGSVEIEALCNSNLRIPYAAIMAVYETKNSVSMVHSYGRNHSLYEIEEGRCILDGKESCWTVRFAKEIKNMAVFHNGHLKVEPQECNLLLTNSEGKEREVSFFLDEIRPFQTVKFELEKISSDYKEFLNNNDGWATIHFFNHSAFTRLLVVWEMLKNIDFQVTHSNFDYSSHQTDSVISSKPAYMKIPSTEQEGSLSKVIVYPKFRPGKYEVGLSSEQVFFDSGQFFAIDFDKQNSLAFLRQDGDLPSRIVTGYCGNQQDGILPFECSMGVLTGNRPPKSTHWFPVSKVLKSKIYMTSYPEIYEFPPDGCQIEATLYNAYNKDTVIRNITFSKLEDIPNSLELETLFGDEVSSIGVDFGYIIMKSTYGGFFIFSSLQKKRSLTLEHSF